MMKLGFAFVLLVLACSDGMLLRDYQAIELRVPSDFSPDHVSYDQPMKIAMVIVASKPLLISTETNAFCKPPFHNPVS